MKTSSTAALQPFSHTPVPICLCKACQLNMGTPNRGVESLWIQGLHRCEPNTSFLKRLLLHDGVGMISWCLTLFDSKALAQFGSGVNVPGECTKQ